MTQQTATNDGSRADRVSRPPPLPAESARPRTLLMPTGDPGAYDLEIVLIDDSGHEWVLQTQRIFVDYYEDAQREGFAVLRETQGRMKYRLITVRAPGKAAPMPTSPARRTRRIRRHDDDVKG